MRGRLPSTLPVLARENPRRRAANARAAVMDKMADQPSARAEVHAARQWMKHAEKSEKEPRRLNMMRHDESMIQNHAIETW